MIEDRISVLIVDRDRAARSVMQKILEEAGYAVDTAENGLEALEKSEVKRFDVALVDIELPDVEGPELLLKLPNNSEMVKIVIARFSTAENGVRAADCGADDFLVKPIQPGELLQAIRSRLVKA
jgi:two-component system nitrogen regulation response regulator NtrX